jgi:hypothetical protein
MRKGAAQDLAVKHTGHGNIADEFCRAGNFLDTVDALDVVSDEFEFSLGHELSD